MDSTPMAMGSGRTASSPGGPRMLDPDGRACLVKSILRWKKNAHDLV